MGGWRSNGATCSWQSLGQSTDEADSYVRRVRESAQLFVSHTYKLHDLVHFKKPLPVWAGWSCGGGRMAARQWRSSLFSQTVLDGSRRVARQMPTTSRSPVPLENPQEREREREQLSSKHPLSPNRLHHSRVLPLELSKVGWRLAKWAPVLICICQAALLDEK